LLTERKEIRNVLVIMVSSDTGLAGSYNVNILRSTLLYFDQFEKPVDFICVGRKGRDLLLRGRAKVIAELLISRAQSIFWMFRQWSFDC
jgi:F-type H+-transporting ATPase subunit gamma